MPGTHPPADHFLTAQEIEYLEKIKWAWQQLSFPQRSKIIQSINDGTLRQGSGKHCFIAEAISVNVKTSIVNHSLFDKIIWLVNAVFYNGPSYDLLFNKKIPPNDRNKLNDIYYAKIGNKYHQYQKATELLQIHVPNLSITIKH